MIRGVVELLCQVAERLFGCSKVRYQGIKKGVGQTVMAFGLVNLWQECKPLRPLMSEICLWSRILGVTPQMSTVNGKI
jgi:hypothetical protein